MLPILALLVASSALASAGLVNIKQYNYDAVLNDDSLIGRALKVMDGGDVGPNEVYLAAVLRDLASLGGNQDLVNGQSVAVLGELATGRPGDACAAANYINAYTRYVESGNPAGVREALASYIQVVTAHIDNLTKLITDKNSVRFASGIRGGCAGEGRSFQFEPAWDVILGSVPANQQSLIAEEYGVAKRQYCSLNAIGSNMSAQLTASALPPTVEVFKLSSGALNEFLTRFAAKTNPGQAASSLKQALSSAVGRVTL